MPGLQRVPEQHLGLLLVRAVDAHLGLEDRYEPGRGDPRAVLDLLVDDGGDAVLVGVLDHRPHLGAEDAVLVRPLEQLVEGVDRLHQLDAVALVGEALVDLEERHDLLLLPQVARGRDAEHVPLHRLLEQDRAEDAGAVEGRAGDDAGAHLVDEVEHLGLGVVAALVDAVLGQRLRACCRRSGRAPRRTPAPSRSVPAAGRPYVKHSPPACRQPAPQVAAVSPAVDHDAGAAVCRNGSVVVERERVRPPAELWMAWAFGLGSACFLVGPFPGYATLVGAARGRDHVLRRLDPVHRGRRAAELARRAAPGGRPAGPGGLVAAIVQSAGTLFFNVTTFRALQVDALRPDYDRLVWRPDAFGSICFLVSGVIAYRGLGPPRLAAGAGPGRAGGSRRQPARLRLLRHLRRRRLRRPLEPARCSTWPPPTAHRARRRLLPGLRRGHRSGAPPEQR